MTGIPGPEKVRYVVGVYTVPVVVLCLVVAVAGVAGAWTTYANPPTTEVAEHENRQSVAVGLDTQATVEGESAMYDPGEKLANEPIYLLGATPNLTFQATVESDPATELDATTWLILVYEAQTADGEVFWERSRVLAREEGTGREGTMRTEATVDVRSVRGQLSTLRDEVGDAGEVTAYVRVRTEYDTEDYEGSLDDQAALTVQKNSYTVGSVSGSEDHSVTSTRTRPIPGEVYRTSLPGAGPTVVPHTTVLFALLALAGLVGTVGAAVGGRRIDAGPARRRLHENRYGDWISEGSLPAGPRGTLVVMTSLEGVVDAAIDAGKRVVFDPDQERYAVFDDGVTYAYFPGSDDSPENGSGDSPGREEGDSTGGGADDLPDDARQGETDDAPNDSPADGSGDPADDLQIDSLADYRADSLDDVPTDPDSRNGPTNPDDE